MNPKAPLMALVLTLALVVPVGAIDVPQTRQEFVQAVAAGEGATAVETIVSDQPLDRVWTVLEERVGACLDVTVKRTAYVGYVERSSSEYNPTLSRVDGSRGEFTLQVAHNPRGVGHTPPPGGLFMMAADLRALEDGRTEVVLYRPTLGVKKIVASLRKWFEADPTPCPKLK